jgi:arginase
MSRHIRIFGVPMDLGQRRRGVDMGPSAIRYAGLHDQLRALGYTLTDSGNLSVPLPENEPPDDSRARHLHSIAGVCWDIYQQALVCGESGELPIFLGGDHSLSIGTVAAITASVPDIGVLWVDAHGDFNTPEITPSGNVHGMALATLLGRGAPELTGIGRPAPKLKPSQVVILGARDIDLQEKTALREAGVLVITMRDIDTIGLAGAAQQAVAHFGHLGRIHVSLDMDALDPAEAPGVGTPVPGGLAYREAHLLMEILHDAGKVASLDIVEINPILDDRNRTAKLAVELVASLFGKSIL